MLTNSWLFTLTFLLPILLQVQASSSSSSSQDNLDFEGFHNIATMPYPASDMTVDMFPENLFTDNRGPRMYLTGGCVTSQTCSKDANGMLTCFCTGITNKVIYFTPENPGWVTLSTVMPRDRYRHMSTSIGPHLYVIGGRTLNDSLIPQIDRYNVQTNVWESSAFIWSNPSSDGAAFAIDDMLYIVGGYDAMYNTLASVTTLNVTSGAFGQAANMSVGRGDISLTEWNGKFFVMGGWNAQTSGGFCNASQAVEYFSVHDQQWHHAPNMKGKRGDLATGVLADSLFAVGGETKDSNDKTCSLSVPIEYVERLIDGAASWVQEEDLPQDLFRFVGMTYNSSTNLYSNAFYLFGGQGTFDSKTMTYPIKDSTMKYVPASIGGRKAKLSSGGIAGITIAAIAVAIFIVVLIVAYLEYRRRHKYTNLDQIEQDEEAKRHQENDAAKMELADMSESFDQKL